MGMREKHFLTFISYETSIVLPGDMSFVSALHAQGQDARRFSLSVANYENIKPALLLSFPLQVFSYVRESYQELRGHSLLVIGCTQY
jgi:hypothetical protein